MGSSPQWLALFATSFITVVSYTLTVPSPTHAPTAWSLQYFDPLTQAWITATPVDTCTVTNWSYANLTQTFTVAVEKRTARNAVRLYITSSASGSAAEIAAFTWNGQETLPYVYPPQVMNSDTITVSAAAYGNGVYTLKRSGTITGAIAYGPFTDLGTQVWQDTVASALYNPFYQISMCTPMRCTYYMLLPSFNTVGSFDNTRLLNMPISWQLQRSDDEVNWQTVDTRVNVVWQYRNEMKLFQCNGAVDYAIHYRILISAVNASGTTTDIGKFRLFGDEWTCLEYPPASLLNGTGVVTEYSSAYALTSAQTTYRYGDGTYQLGYTTHTGTSTSGDRAFTKSSSDSYKTTDGDAKYLSLRLPQPIRLLTYSLAINTADAEAATRAPAAWRVEAKADSQTTWDVIDTRSGQSWANAFDRPYRIAVAFTGVITTHLDADYQKTVGAVALSPRLLIGT
jgi:hypothetical protein